MSSSDFNGIYNFMKDLAAKNRASQTVNPGDYVGPDGLLICGKCGEPRQRYVSIKDPTIGNPEGRSNIKVSTFCKCEREQREKAEQEKRAVADAKVVSKLKEKSEIEELYQTATFENFEVDKNNKGNFNMCRNYVKEFDRLRRKEEGYNGLLLWGKRGTGKSYSAVCIANALIEQKVPVVVTSFPDILKEIHADFSREKAITDELNKAPLVIIDDLGTERDTDYALEKIYNIINSRHIKRLPMIVTTNLTLDYMMGTEDDRYGRIYERVMEDCFPLQYTGQSWRLKHARDNYDEMRMLLEGGE